MEFCIQYTQKNHPRQFLPIYSPDKQTLIQLIHEEKENEIKMSFYTPEMAVSLQKKKVVKN